MFETSFEDSALESSHLVLKEEQKCSVQVMGRAFLAFCLKL